MHGHSEIQPQAERSGQARPVAEAARAPLRPHCPQGRRKTWQGAVGGSQVLTVGRSPRSRRAAITLCMGHSRLARFPLIFTVGVALIGRLR
ncbi:MAG: hypothetical protein ACK56I_36175, partial [bacterium]